jgi:hypothetical protein
MFGMTAPQLIVPVERIASRIYLIRGEKVMLDADFAELMASRPEHSFRPSSGTSTAFPPNSGSNSLKKNIKTLDHKL